MANEKKMDQVILGLLSHEPLTGYEIKKLIDTTLRLFWGASFGSIYPTLNEMERQGLVSREEVKENRRNKVIYTITGAGRQHLRDWLELPSVKDEVRYETLLKLFFGSGIGAEGTLKHIENFESKIRQELPILEHSVQVLEPIQDMAEEHTYYMLTAMFGVKAYQAYLEWCEEAKKILEDNRKDG